MSTLYSRENSHDKNATSEKLAICGQGANFHIWNTHGPPMSLTSYKAPVKAEKGTEHN